MNPFHKKPKVIKNEEILDKYLNEDKIVVIDFFSDDCGTCKTMEPVFDGYSKNYKNAKFIKVNIDELEVGRRFSVTTVPSFQFFKSGEKIGDVSGARPGLLKSTVQELLA